MNNLRPENQKKKKGKTNKKPISQQQNNRNQQTLLINSQHQWHKFFIKKDTELTDWNRK